MQTKHEPSKETRLWQRLLFAHLPTGEQPSEIYRLSVSMGLGLAAAVFAAVPLLFSVNPLPLALLCAVEGQALPWVLGGLLIGVWQGGSSYWYAVSALCVLPLRAIARLYLTPADDTGAPSPRELRSLYLTRLRSFVKRLFGTGGSRAYAPPDKGKTLPPLFNEPIYLRSAVSVLCALIPAVALPSSGGFAYYDLYGAIFTLALTPSATALFSHLTVPRAPADTRRDRLLSLGGGLLLIGALCLCGRSAMILGLSPIVVMGTLLSFATVRSAGLGAGLGVGLVCGLCYDPLTIPMFLLLALIYALLCEVMGEFALFPSVLGGMLYLLLCGAPAAFWSLSPSLVAGCVAFGSGRRISKRLKEVASAPSPSPPAENEWKQRFWEEEARHNDLLRRLSSMSGAFSHLSEIFRQLEKSAARPTLSSLRQLCGDVLEKHCPDCPRRSLCLDEQSLSLMTSLQALCRALDEQGRVSEEQLESGLRARCPQKRAIIQEINEAMTRLSYESLRREGGAPFAGECDEIAHLLRDAVIEDDGQAKARQNAAQLASLRAFLSSHNMPVDHVILTGSARRELRLVGVTPASLTLPTDAFRQEVARILDAPVSQLRFDAGDRGCMSLHTLPPLRADYVHRTLSCEQSPDRPSGRCLCGDTLRVFVREQATFYALICDGMGKGRHAAMTSGAAGVFLERTLKSGVDVNTALRMLNHYLLSRSHSPEEEISSTIDLFCLDLYTGQGYFLKSGAAPSLILREGRLFRLSSHTLPIGILQAIDAQIIPFEVQDGDHILLMSDGVSDLEGGEGATNDWLSDYLAGPLPEDDSALINQLFSLAREHGSFDDMSMISIRISTDR